MEYCTLEQQQDRLNICKECDKFSFKEDNITYCAAANLDISLISSTLDINCPLEKF